MSAKLDYMRQLALAHTQHFGSASTQEILERAGVDLSSHDDDADPAIGELEKNLNDDSGLGAIMLCRSRTGYAPANATGNTGNIASFIASGNHRDAPRGWPTREEGEAAATRLNAMALARNDKSDGTPVETPKTLDELVAPAYAKWNSASKRNAAEAAEE